MCSYANHTKLGNVVADDGDAMTRNYNQSKRIQVYESQGRLSLLILIYQYI